MDGKLNHGWCLFNVFILKNGGDCNNGNILTTPQKIKQYEGKRVQDVKLDMFITMMKY